jgi:hypothetical protein
MVEIDEVKLDEFFSLDWRIFLPQVFDYSDILDMEMLCYGDVLFRRRCVTGDVMLRRRFVTETFCMETFSMCAHFLL